MAETYTMQPSNEVTTLDNLTPEEQDSLAVGEQMQEAQDNLLAGKYQNAQELEQGYLELQKKLGQDDEEYEEEGDEEEEYEEGDEEYEDDEGEEYESVLDELWDESQDDEDDEYSEDLLERISEMDPQDLAMEYIDYRQSVEDRDFSDEEISDLYTAAGGQEQYANLIDWAQNNLSQQETDMFDAVMDQGNALAAFFAIRALAFTYENAVGVDGDLVQGKAPRSSGSQFRSQAEVVAAMADPRYETDPAYRNDIMRKLERSPNVAF